MPFNTTFVKTLEDERLQERFQTLASPADHTAQISRLITDVDKVGALRERRERVKEELEHLKKVTKHQQLCMTIMGGTNTLHPALEQSSTNKPASSQVVLSSFKKY